MRWLYVLHGAAHANWGLSIPPWGLQNQLLKKSQKCNTFHAKLGFSWLRVAKTRTPLDCVKLSPREPKLILEGSVGGLFFRLFFAFVFLGFWMVLVRFGTPGEGQNPSKLQKVGFGSQTCGDFRLFLDFSLQVLVFSYILHQNLLHFSWFSLAAMQARLLRFSLVLQQATMQIIL